MILRIQHLRYVFKLQLTVGGFALIRHVLKPLFPYFEDLGIALVLTIEDLQVLYKNRIIISELFYLYLCLVKYRRKFVQHIRGTYEYLYNAKSKLMKLYTNYLLSFIPSFSLL